LGFRPSRPVVLLLLTFLSFSEAAYSEFRLNDSDPGAVKTEGVTVSLRLHRRFHISLKECITGYRCCPSDCISAYSRSKNSNNSSHDFYQYNWFRRATLLVYLLSVTVGGDALYRFLVPGGTYGVTYKPSAIVVYYVLCVSLDSLIVWTYVFVCLSVHGVDSGLSLHWKQRWTAQFLPHSVSQKGRGWTYAIVLNGNLVGFFGVSVA